MRQDLFASDLLPTYTGVRLEACQDQLLARCCREQSESNFLAISFIASVTCYACWVQRLNLEFAWAGTAQLHVLFSQMRN